MFPARLLMCSDVACETGLVGAETPPDSCFIIKQSGFKTLLKSPQMRCPRWTQATHPLGHVIRLLRSPKHVSYVASCVPVEWPPIF